MRWKDGKVSEATIHSLLGRTCVVHQADETTLLETEAGKAYALP